MVADNTVEGAGPEMNAKAGRKVLLLGVPCQTAPGPVQSVAGENAIRSNIEERLTKGLHGDYSGQIDDSGVNEQWKPLVKAVNDINRKREEENSEIIRLRELEGTRQEQESKLLELSVLKESIFGKNPMPLLLSLIHI